MAGDFLFLLTNTPSVVCFRADTGQVVWVTPLEQWKSPDDKSGEIVWTGPVLASNRLIMVSSIGKAIRFRPIPARCSARSICLME